MIDEEKLIKFLQDEKEWNMLFLGDSKTEENVMKVAGRIDVLVRLISKIQTKDFEQITENVKQ